jgi:hypothetical protein
VFRPFRSTVIAAIATLTPTAATFGQSSVAVSPFVSYVPSATTNPLVGMALTFGGTTGLALRGSADISISNPKTDAGDGATSSGGPRPWAADADAVLFLNGLGGGATVFSRTLAPYLFSGISLFGGDSAGTNVVNNGWSYGAGASIPLGLDADIFAEARWRMSEYVLPTAKMAPDAKSELRFGLSFLVGGSREPARPPRRRHAYYDDDEYYEPRAVAPAPAPVIVQAPAPVIVQAPAPVIVQAPTPVIITQPAPPPHRVTQINVNVPWHGWPRRSRAQHSTGTTVTVTTPTRIKRPEMRRRR